MAFCTRCGTGSNGAFCPQCGAQMAPAQPQPPAPAPAPAPQQPYYPPAAPYGYAPPPPPKKARFPWIGLAVVGGVLLLGLGAYIALEGAPSSPPSRSGSSSGTSPTPNTPAPAPKANRKPGYITGIVLDERGAPLRASSDQVVLRVGGQRSSDGQEMTGTPKMQADGRFEVKVPDGNYTVNGYVRVTFEGTEFWLSLDPSGGNTPQSSRDGLYKELRLKLSGQRPGGAGYYGGHITMQYQGRTLPDDSQVKFTLTPAGPLADGSQGKPLTYTATGRQLRSNARFTDIPLGRYRITGEVTLANGTRKAALISLATGQPAPSQEVGFKPNPRGEGVEGTALWMMGEQ